MMLDRYRKQFIRLNMLLVGSVLAVMLILVAVYMYNDYYNELETTMSEIVKPMSGYGSSVSYTGRGQMAGCSPTAGASDTGSSDKSSSDTGGPGADRSSQDSSDKRRQTEQTEDRHESGDGSSGSTHHKGINTIFYNAEEDKLSILSSSLVFTEEEIAEALPLIITQEENFGVLRDYGMIYYYAGGSSSYRVAIARTWYIWESMLDLMAILLAVYAAAMAVIRVIVGRTARMAVNPLEEAMSREKQFIADASHDLKTPLTVILANTGIMKKSPESSIAEKIKWLDSTEAAAHNMQELVSEMLTLSRVESKSDRICLVDLNLSDIAERAVLSLESVAYEKGVTLESDIPEQIRITADAEYLERVIMSLTENAIKYEPAGGKVSLQVVKSRNQVRVKIHNQGSFISSADLPHVFDRFYRADKTRNTESGHGLGLAIAKSMTELMEGELSVTSRAGEGTDFILKFGSR